MRPTPGDDEVNGAAAALLGLYSSTRTPSPRPNPPAAPPAPAPSAPSTSRPPPDAVPPTKRDVYPTPWNGGNFLITTPGAPPVPDGRARSAEYQPRSTGMISGPGEHPGPAYSFFPTAVGSPAVVAPNFELPIRSKGAVKHVGFPGISAQDLSFHRNNFLGGGGTFAAAAAAAIAAGGWTNPLTTAREPQQQYQQQQQSHVLTPRLAPQTNVGRPSFAGAAEPPAPVPSAASWSIPHSAPGVSPQQAVPAIAVPHIHQQQVRQASMKSGPASAERAAQRQASPVQRERSMSVGASRPSAGGGEESGRRNIVGEDQPQVVPYLVSQHQQHERRKLPPPPPRPIQPHHQHSQQKRQQQEKGHQIHQQQQQQQQQPPRHGQNLAINNLRSLIPGMLWDKTPDGQREEDGARMFASTSKRQRGLADSTAGCRWYPADIHPPLSDSARRHRARALARLRARRRVLAAATAAAAAGAASAPPKHSSLSRFASNVSNTSTDSSESGGGGVMENNIDHTSGVVGGGASISSGSKDEATVEGSIEGNVVADVASSGGGGDLFELIRNAPMNAAAAALAVEGGAGGGASGGGSGNAGSAGDSRSSDDREVGGESREVGKPVKYKYRQEAARSRKRTRGRFVSEKAPAFVSITELMDLRRAERERQQQQEAHPAPVVISGVGAG